MKHYLKYTAEGAYCGEKVSQTVGGLYYSNETTLFPEKTTCPECLAKLEADDVRMEAIRKKHRIEATAPDLLEALETIVRLVDDSSREEVNEAVNVARAVIQKAQGSSE